MAAAAITGSFADFKIIKSRGVCQIVIEVDLRNADVALATLGGVPQPESERPVAVARLNVDKPAPDKRPYADRGPGEQAVTRAAMLCDDGAFQAWLGAADDEGAAQMVRDYCHVKSRREIASNVEALDRFLKLEGDWKRRVPHANGAAR